VNLKRIRKKIDRIDRRILRELNQRFKLARKTRAYKTRVSDPERERMILEQIKKQVTRYSEIRKEFALGLFDFILSESRRIQKEKNTRRTP